MRLVFFGTPEFAVPTLDAIAQEHQVAMVVAQPDKPSGRGLRVQPPAVAVRARELGLTVIQPAKIRTAEFRESIALLNPDAAVVIAYGRILPAPLLAIPRHGFLNVHASLLPRYRGAAPIQRAIEEGQSQTGVTVMQVDEELDHGPMLAVSRLEIGPDEHTPSLSRRLSKAGAVALLEVLRGLELGTDVSTEQNHEQATIAPKIDKTEGLVSWADRASRIYDRYRAFDPWPGIFTRDGVKLNEVLPVDGEGMPGTILEIGEGVVVATGSQALRIVTMQRPGKPRAAAADVARGLGWRVGARLS